MLDEICMSLRNWFCSESDIHSGTFTIANGSINLSFVVNGQYFRIVGSRLNDGVYIYPTAVSDDLEDETFTGEIWAMSVPKAVIRLADDISEWQNKNGDPGVFTSESFGGSYSYSRATNAKGGQITWQDAFKSRLARWRKA